MAPPASTARAIRAVASTFSTTNSGSPSDCREGGAVDLWGPAMSASRVPFQCGHHSGESRQALHQLPERMHSGAGDA